MCDLVARTGRHQQRYEAGCRLVAGLEIHDFLAWIQRYTDSDREQLHKCIPFRYKNCDTSDGKHDMELEVLMINSSSGPGLLFPKGGWENDETVEEAAVREVVEEAGVRGDIVSFLGDYLFKSKTLQDEFSPEGLCKAAIFALQVREELQSWPEQSTRCRSWVTLPEAVEQCRHPWMRDALVQGFSKWHEAIRTRAKGEATQEENDRPGEDSNLEDER